MIPEGDPRHKKFEYCCSRNRLEKMTRSDRVLYAKETLTLMSAHMSVSIDRSRSSRAWAIIPLPLMESASENRSRSWAWAWVVHPQFGWHDSWAHDSWAHRQLSADSWAPTVERTTVERTTVERTDSWAPTVERSLNKWLKNTRKWVGSALSTEGKVKWAPN
jgi:hypothetical protein